MKRMFSNPRRQKVGLAPGSMIYTGKRKVDAASMNLFDYDEAGLLDEAGVSIERVQAARAADRVIWVDVIGLHDTDLIAAVGESFELHPLTMEDIVGVGQRPKLEAYPDYLYLVLRMLHVDDDGVVDDEQISLILGDGFVLTFQERPGDVFEPVRERLRHGRGRLRRSGADYLCYALVDVLVDASFLVIERFGERGEALEELVIKEPTPDILQALNTLKRETLLLRRAVWPVRELLGSLQREESPLVSASVQVFFRDAYDHSVQVLESVESLRELLASLHDYYMSSLSHRMNEVMKVLTVVGTIFLPLSFLVGVYGMNFDNIPELHLRWGYQGLWLFMVAIVVGMLLFFRRRRWI